MRTQVLGNATAHFSISSSWEIFAFLGTTYNTKPFKMFGKSWRGVFPDIAYAGTGSTGRQGMVFDLSFDRVYTFTPVCPK